MSVTVERDPERAAAHPALRHDLELWGVLRDPALGPVHLSRERRRVRAVLAAGGWAVAGQRGLAVVRLLPWDTEHFGCGCADLVRLYLDPRPDPGAWSEAEALVQAVVSRCRSEGVRLLSARVPACCVAALHGLTAAGADLLDTSVELCRKGAGAMALPEPEAGVQVRPGRPEDLPALQQIARTFNRNRFHRDPRIPPARAGAVYARWVEAALAGRHGSLLLCEVEGRVAGLATYTRLSGRLDAGLVALVAVHPEQRGRGLLGPLVAGCARALGCGLLVSSTQVSNGPALRAFARQGLLPFAARHVFHLWLD